MSCPLPHPSGLQCSAVQCSAQGGIFCVVKVLGEHQKERKPRRREIIITREREMIMREGEREKERERERERGGGGGGGGRRERIQKRDEGVWKVKISEKNR